MATDYHAVEGYRCADAAQNACSQVEGSRKIVFGQWQMRLIYRIVCDSQVAGMSAHA